MTAFRARTLLSSLLAVLALLVAACSSTPAANSTTSTPAASASSTSSAPSTSASTSKSGESSASSGSTAASPAGPAEVGTHSGPLGTYIADSEGKTLYMFLADAKGSPSTCYEQCAAAWPPLLTTGAPTATGTASATLLGTTPRTDGTTQVTYGGWPVYYFAKDKTVGDTTGQGVGKVKWWILGVDGEPITTEPAAATSSSS